MIKGWCPGTLRPMMSGDGLIVRLKISGGRLTPQRLRAIADMGRRFGNGAFDLSQRANLQMRGVRERDLPALQAGLDSLGLLPQDAASEQVLNIIAPPLAGVDEAAILDMRPYLHDLEEVLRADKALHALPGKFGFALDDGGALSMTDAPADILLEAIPTPTGPQILLRLAGETRFGACVAPEKAVAGACDLADIFLRRRKDFPAVRRMRRLTAEIGAEAIFREAGFLRTPIFARPPVKLRDLLGQHALDARSPDKGPMRYGFAAAFGRWSADDLDNLARAAEKYGLTDISLTHWRVILLNSGLVANQNPQNPRDPFADPDLTNLITEASDPRLAIVACVGAPACPSAKYFTREAARAFAQDFLTAGATLRQEDGVRLHLSGCEKACAHPQKTPFALVGRTELSTGESARFDLIIDGAPSDPPAARNLDLSAARCAILRHMAKQSHDNK